MRPIRLAWLGPLALLVLVLAPVSSATPTANGTVTTCSSTSSCQYTLNTSVGAGWASTGGGLLSFQLPNEARASYNLSYSTFTESLTGTYTYWTVGSFLGTDVNTGTVVYGTTNTNYTITCHGHSGRGGGCTYTYTTDNGTIVFELTAAELTATSITCAPASIHAGARTVCTVSVTNLWNSSNVPTGKIHLASSGVGTFANRGTCSLVAGKCSIGWRPGDNTIGSITITASYLGTTSFWTSSGTTSVSVSGGSGDGD